MGQMLSADRRLHKRYPLAAALRFHHQPSRRDYPARCVDASQGGLMMHAPARAPLKPGQVIRLTLSAPAGTEEAGGPPGLAGLAERPIDATIIRIDRQTLLKEGCLGVGVQFTRPAA